MISTEYSHVPQATKRGSTTMSFGAHRQSDMPASAIRAGGSSMPAAWQTRGTQHNGNLHQFGAPVRSFRDILTDPFRKVLTSLPRKIAFGGVLVISGITLIF